MPVKQCNPPRTARRQIERGRRAKPAGADNHHIRLLNQRSHSLVTTERIMAQHVGTTRADAGGTPDSSWSTSLFDDELWG
jgi:hypothetical protein